jgi:hypothetical protein
LVRSEPNGVPPEALHKRRPARIRFDLIAVMVAVDLNDKLVRNTGEICHVRTDRVLSPIFDALHTVGADQFPANAFGITGISAQFPCSLRLPGHGPLS